MREVLTPALEDLLPEPGEVLAARGLPDEARFHELVEVARAEIEALSEPRGVREELTTEEFTRVYRGDGDNDPATPLDSIAPAADRLALFAVTLGEKVSETVSAHFEERDLAAGWMLDAVASLAADAAAHRAAVDFSTHCRRKGAPAPAVLPYSPGYCGWAVSGQRRLFAKLRPEEVGITLGPSCVMRPLKSVSGVLVAGSPEAHDFDNDFDFCGSCSTRECEERIGRLEGMG
ncbi:MAG: hypothetical protein ACC742_12830 [Thermoanaerobaculales bacterium]